MPLEIHDTLTREKRLFTPLVPGKVGIYVCGVTVYDHVHVGHARAAIVFDIVTRWLRQIGYDVTLVRNYTDVDDKIIKRANERGVTSDDISDEYIQAFEADMGQLGMIAPSVAPRATDHIPGMIDVIEQLIAKGFAYPSNGDVYFSVPSYPKYGRLSRRKLEDMRAGARVEIDEQKRDPADFALWKTAKPGEPSWDSPWGKGRPGWHIECSAMAKKHLGQTIDIHGGGEDLVFPHHENEIAQSEGASGLEFSRFWMHNAFVKMNSEKMSKSLGNVVRLRDVMAKYPGEAFRLFCLIAHYRSPIDFTDAAMENAREALERLYKSVAEAAVKFAAHMSSTLRLGPAEEPDLEAIAATMEARFHAAMNDDFNTAAATAVLFEVARALNRLTAKAAPTSGDVDLAQKLSSGLRTLGGILGLLTDSPEHMLDLLRKGNVAATGLSEADIEAKIAARDDAKKARDFKTADEIRAWLKERGITLDDVKGGKTIWRRS